MSQKTDARRERRFKPGEIVVLARPDQVDETQGLKAGMLVPVRHYSDAADGGRNRVFYNLERLCKLHPELEGKSIPHFAYEDQLETESAAGPDTTLPDWLQ